MLLTSTFNRKLLVFGLLLRLKWILGNKQQISNKNFSIILLHYVENEYEFTLLRLQQVKYLKGKIPKNWTEKTFYTYVNQIKQ